MYTNSAAGDTGYITAVPPGHAAFIYPVADTGTVAIVRGIILKDNDEPNN